eukprot:scaffold4182_cov384-Prasinococcus_capsulatus_cf.AAC.5
MKVKKCIENLGIHKPDDTHMLSASLECELPNNSLYTFEGKLQHKDETLSLGPISLALRGCSLRNTEYIIGGVVFTGHDSKVMMNAREAPSKRSTLERRLDYVILGMFALLIVFCAIGAAVLAQATGRHGSSYWYLALDSSELYDPSEKFKVGGFAFLTSFILYGYLVPISLYITIEFVKIVGALGLISKDRDMYHEDTNTPAAARTSNLNEELGQVEYVLSDKTGTLTRNVMEFFKMSVAGVKYGKGSTEIEVGLKRRRGQPLDTEDNMVFQPQEKFFNFHDERIENLAWMKEPGADSLRLFFRILAVAHTVFPDGPRTPDEIQYEAESPDEAALVVAAKRFGLFFHSRSIDSVTIREPLGDGSDRDVEYRVLNVLEFNSTRKRMSVICQRADDDRIMLFCKGADTVIYERLSDTGRQHAGATKRHLEEFGEAGLRTLCLAYTEIPADVYEGWNRTYIQAKAHVGGNRAELLMEVAEEIEKDLTLLGATAIDDKLQEGVPKCISDLAFAGIKIWVLTGDKLETAKNIGYACSLLTNNQKMHHVTLPEQLEESSPEAAQLISTSLDGIKGHMKSAPNRKHSLIIDGRALKSALHPQLRKDFCDIGLKCVSVVCCRISPLQKALVAALVKERTGKVTLAIGDGANDVGMIQTADIGVGISGHEGMQAVLASDFAIAQFRFLSRLLLLHGRWCYIRLAKMVCFFFYKNLLLGICLFCYNGASMFSGTTIFNDYSLSAYNVLFTSFPPLACGILEQDVRGISCTMYPALYQDSQRNIYFKWR